MVRFAAAESNLCAWPHIGIEPVAGDGCHAAQIELLRRSGDRLQPKAYPGAIVGSDHHCLAVWGPERTVEVAVDRLSDIAAVSLYAIHEEDILKIAIQAVARIKIGYAFTVRRGNWKRRKLRVRRDRLGFPRGKIHNLRRGVK